MDDYTESRVMVLTGLDRWGLEPAFAGASPGPFRCPPGG
jgi:hypothetical protein